MPPPWIYSPKEAQYIYREGRVSLTGPNVTSVPASLVFNIPRNNVGVIREINLNINDMVAATVVTWSLRFNDGPVQGFDNLTLFPRIAASVSATFPPESTLINAPDGAKIDIQITLVSATSHLIGATFRGWFYSKEVAYRYGFF